MAQSQEIYSCGMRGALRRVRAASRSTIGHVNAPQPWRPMLPGRRSVRYRKVTLLPWISDTAALLCILGFMPLAMASASFLFGVL